MPFAINLYSDVYQLILNKTRKREYGKVVIPMSKGICHLFIIPAF